MLSWLSSIFWRIFSLSVLLRVLFVVFVPAVVINALTIVYPDRMDPTVAIVYTAIAAFVALGVVFYEWRLQREIVHDLVAIVFGTAAGLFVCALFVLIALTFCLPSGPLPSGEPLPMGLAFARAFREIQPWIPLILLTCCYIGITVVLQTKDDFRFLVPYIDFSQRGTQEGGIVLDTSALVDGRIADICETRLLSVPLVIPDYVIRELQTLADSANKLKRQRGRRGLDMVTALQKNDAARVTVRATDAPPGSPVDRELVNTAKEIHGRILTTDFNLNKVSRIEGVPVINLNDLANALKPAVIPGEELSVKIVRAGQEAGQGVGYLDDGTMVVVEGARDSVGGEIAARITGQIQTSAGRMIFGKLVDDE